MNRILFLSYLILISWFLYQCRRPRPSEIQTLDRMKLWFLFDHDEWIWEHSWSSWSRSTLIWSSHPRVFLVGFTFLGLVRCLIIPPAVRKYSKESRIYLWLWKLHSSDWRPPSKSSLSPVFHWPDRWVDLSLKWRLGLVF